ncbi:MAG: serine hydrolase, partial [Nocardioidaceae bacterium]|nr:serine hydrolase [Nocardioidaceae bacterium]
LRADHQRWSVTEPVDAHSGPVPVAASYAWVGDDTLEVDVHFLETPHRLTVRCAAGDRSARVAWNVAPLDGGGLATLHRPG